MKKITNETRINRLENNCFKNLINDNEITVIEKGIMIMLLSKPDGWVFESAKFYYETGLGISNYNKAIKKLISLNYLEKKRIKSGVSWVIKDKFFKRVVEPENISL